MKDLIHNKGTYKLVNIFIWFLIFTIVPVILQIAIYAFLPFDYFVKIKSYVVEDTNTQVLTINLNRIARFDIEATSLKEYYRITENGDAQVYESEKRVFIYETEANNRTILIKQPIQEMKSGDYYISDYISLQLPRGITKTKTIKSN